MSHVCEMTMEIAIEINNCSQKIDGAKPLDISIPLKFNGDQPNAFGVPKATSTPCKSEDLIGDTRQGGSCNFEQYTLIPHCNGTHTECIGHITNERISVHDCLRDTYIPSTLISVVPQNITETGERYSVELSENDKLITRVSIEMGISESGSKNSRLTDPHAGLIIRSLPNSTDKLTREYGDYVPPFFSNEAMEFIAALGIRHLLVDLPSIDRIFDAGKLSNHRKFWNVNDGKLEVNDESKINNTITELIYVPNEIKDGNYLLNLQIAAFKSDVSPSRPILFELT